jgi:probable O-glycosylation ligase (exosortase A-associated)
MHHAADTWAKWWFVSKILLMTLVTACIVNSFERLHRLITVIAACFGFFIVKSVPFIIATGGNHRIYGPDDSMIADNNDFGLALNMTLPLLFFLGQSGTKPWLRRVWAVLFLLAIPTIFFTYSRGALVGLIAIFLAFSVFLSLKQRLLIVPVACAGILVAVLFAPPAWKYRMNPNREDAVDASAKSRLGAWAYARALAADYPITGGGFEAFTQDLFNRYAPGERARAPHSVYFQMLAEHGYVGLFIYLVLIGSCFVTIRRLIAEARLREDYSVRQYASMFQMSLIGFLISGLFLGRAYFDYYFTIVVCVAILKQVAKRRWEEEDELLEEPVQDEVLTSYPSHYSFTRVFQ